MSQDPDPILRLRGDAPQVHSPQNVQLITREDIGRIAADWWEDEKREEARAELLTQLEGCEYLDSLIAFYRDASGYRIFVLDDTGQQSSRRIRDLDQARKELQHDFAVYLSNRSFPTHVQTEGSEQGTGYTLKSHGYRNVPVIATTADLSETVLEAVRTIDYL